MNRRQQRIQVRQVRLREQGYDSYRAYLNSPAWRDVRNRYRASDLPQVCMCGSDQYQLHHATYDRVGHEALDDLIPLCRACHAQAHLLEAAGVIDLDLKGFYYDAARAAANRIARLEREADAQSQVGTDNEQMRFVANHRRKQDARVAMLKARRKETPEQREARVAQAIRDHAGRDEPTAPHANRVRL